MDPLTSATRSWDPYDYSCSRYLTRNLVTLRAFLQDAPCTVDMDPLMLSPNPSPQVRVLPCTSGLVRLCLRPSARQQGRHASRRSLQRLRVGACESRQTPFNVKLHMRDIGALTVETPSAWTAHCRRGSRQSRHASCVRPTGLGTARSL